MIKKENHIDHILKNYKAVLKSDYAIYKNHVYRVYNYAIKLDTKEENYEKYAIAAAFHDLGIWTHSFNYLAPSIKMTIEYLKSINREKLIEEITLMIDNHHKRSKFTGKYEHTVEVFRQSDWIDVTRGRKMFKLSKINYKKIGAEFPNKGFHYFLMKQTLKYFVKHPFNPLPMFKK